MMYLDSWVWSFIAVLIVFVLFLVVYLLIFSIWMLVDMVEQKKTTYIVLWAIFFIIFSLGNLIVCLIYYYTEFSKRHKGLFWKSQPVGKRKKVRRRR